MQINDLQDTETLTWDMIAYFTGHNKSVIQLIERDAVNIQLKGDLYTLINIQTVPASLWQDIFISTIYVVQLDMFFHLEGAFKRGHCYYYVPQWDTVVRIFESQVDKVCLDFPIKNWVESFIVGMLNKKYPIFLDSMNRGYITNLKTL